MPSYNRTGKRIVPEEDYSVIKGRYLEGETLQMIADTYDISRERIRQILKRMGVDPKKGGQSRQSEMKRLKRRAKRDRFWLNRYGITVAEREYILAQYGAWPFRAYQYQHRNAIHREIPFYLNFREWWAIWQRSGKWEKRGIHRGQYVMSRYGDQGAYEVGNVHIVLSVENIVESLERRFGGDYSETVSRHKEAA